MTTVGLLSSLCALSIVDGSLCPLHPPAPQYTCSENRYMSLALWECECRGLWHVIRPPLLGVGTCVDSPGEDRECEGVSYNQRWCSVVGSMGLELG